MGKKSRINAKQPNNTEVNADNASRSGSGSWWPLLMGAMVGFLGVSNFFTYNLAQQGAPPTAVVAEAPATVDTNAIPIFVPTVRPDYQIVNAHEHLYREQDLPKYLEAAARMGVARTLFVASSEFTFMGAGGAADKLNDWSTREVLKCAAAYPGKVIPFATMHPAQQDKLTLLQEYVSLGIQGLKLYTGHGEFYERPLNDPDMLEVYAFCEEIGLPLCWHVNFNKYGAEFVEIMRSYPKLKVIVPHFGLGFYDINGPAMALMVQMMEQYPNVYADSSFGTRAFLVNGLEEVHKHHEQFRNLFIRFDGQIVWGTDMVVTGNKDKTPDWIESVIRTCRDMMEKETYFSWMAAKGAPYAEEGADHPYGQLRGMNLPDPTLRKIYETNLDRLLYPSGDI